MKIKLLEIRDDGTTIPAMAIQTEGENEAEQRLFRRGGFGAQSVVLVRLTDDCAAEYSFSKWREPWRTMREAHKYVLKHFDELPAYAVVDVSYILGETTAPKQSEIWRGSHA